MIGTDSVSLGSIGGWALITYFVYIGWTFFYTACGYIMEIRPCFKLDMKIACDPLRCAALYHQVSSSSVDGSNVTKHSHPRSELCLTALHGKQFTL